MFYLIALCEPFRIISRHKRRLQLTYFAEIGHANLISYLIGKHTTVNSIDLYIQRFSHIIPNYMYTYFDLPPEAIRGFVLCGRVSLNIIFGHASCHSSRTNTMMSN